MKSFIILGLLKENAHRCLPNLNRLKLFGTKIGAKKAFWQEEKPEEGLKRKNINLKLNSSNL